MPVVSIKTKGPEERGNMSRAVPPLLLAGEQQVTHAAAVVEATRERRLAALRISELAKQAVDTLLHLAERAIFY